MSSIAGIKRSEYQAVEELAVRLDVRKASFLLIPSVQPSRKRQSKVILGCFIPLVCQAPRGRQAYGSCTPVSTTLSSPQAGGADIETPAVIYPRLPYTRSSNRKEGPWSR
jgi:hypothetical protein